MVRTNSIVKDSAGKHIRGSSGAKELKKPK